MRRDVLELDATAQAVLDSWRRGIGAADYDALRLLLLGSSVVDWQRLSFRTLDEVDEFLRLHLLDMDDSGDRERLRYVFSESVSYLEEHLHLRFPRSLRSPEDVRMVFVWASQFGGFRRTQILSCVILKLMHVIHHMEAADLKFKTPMSEEALFDRARARIMKRALEMRQEGLPVLSFYGSRKSRTSVVTKLLVKADNIAATVFDKLRFRMVVQSRDDLVPALRWLVRNVVPFNYVIPGQTHNNLLEPSVLEDWRAFDSPDAQAVEPALAHDRAVKNEFSGSSYRMVNFIADFPVLLSDSEAPVGAFPFEYGRVVYVMVEFQLLDEETARLNEHGDNAHHLYKERQHREVARRLKRGGFGRTSKDSSG